MKKIPDIIFAVDGAFEDQALKEARSLKLTSYAILNTNGDPDMVEGFIPANTNAVKSLDYLAAELKTLLSGIKVSPVRPKNAINKIENTASEKKTVVAKTPTETKASTESKAPAKKAPVKKTAEKTKEEK